MPQYSGAHYHTTFTANSRTALADAIKTALVAAGWTVASGSSGDWKLDSAVTVNGLQCRVRVFDQGSGDEVRIYISNVGETIIGDTGYGRVSHDAGSQTWHVYANPYFAVFQVLPFVNSTKNLMFGTGWTPEFFHDGSPNECIDSMVCVGHTSSLASFFNWTQCRLFEAIWNTTRLAYTNNGADFGTLKLCLVGSMISPTSVLTAGAVRWAVDGSYHIIDPLFEWGGATAAVSDASLNRIRLVPYDMIHVGGGGPWEAGDEITWDGYVWRAITNNIARGSLFCLKEAV